ncbi:hypothetical protein [Thermodesulfovibrio sp. TK110]
MRQNIIVLVCFFLLIFQPVLVSAGSIPMPTGRTCEGSQMPDGTYIPAGQVREVTYGGVKYRCVGCGSCTPISSGSSSYTPYIPPASTQMAIGLMGAFFSGFFSSLFSGIFDDNSAYDAQKQREYEEQQRRLAEEKKRQEEQKKQLLSQYNSLLAQAKTQTQTGTNQSSSPFTFQTLGSQLTAFQWQPPATLSPSDNPMLNSTDERLITASDLNKIFGNVLQDKTIEKIEEKIDDYGGKIVEKLDKKYGKEWGSKYYEKGLPIVKIAITAKTEGIAQAGAETIDFGISLIPMPALTAEIADIGRKIYTKVAFSALDKFLTETEKACAMFGMNCDKEKFWQETESEMNTGQKIICNWLGRCEKKGE